MRMGISFSKPQESPFPEFHTVIGRSQEKPPPKPVKRPSEAVKIGLY
jgi:hypothetical protein